MIVTMATLLLCLADQDMFQIITGPNMGGKSTYIRQVGVAWKKWMVGVEPLSYVRVSLLHVLCPT